MSEGEKLQRIGIWPDGPARDNNGEYVDADEALELIARLEAQSMTYTHRNGETEPPEVAGWYWYCWHNKHGELLQSCVVEMQWHPGDDAWQSFEMNGSDFDYDLDGQWWGPVTPPWETNA